MFLKCVLSRIFLSIKYPYFRILSQGKSLGLTFFSQLELI